MNSGHMQKWLSILFFSHLLLFQSFISFAGVSTDGTMGPARSLSGPDFSISHDLGTLSGRNLFHSFTTFSISQGESATFTGPSSIANVISRVTGGETSSIDGLLRSEVGTANFFFINPSGVVFGENAKVDVPAAFHVGTADEIRFSDGAVFSAADPVACTLTVAQPESFGFLTPQAAAISINDAVLEFAPESRVSLSAGSLEVSGTSLINRAELSALEGEITLLATGEQTGAVSFAGLSEIPWSGNINIENGYIEVDGAISIQGGGINIMTSEIYAGNSGEYDIQGGIGIIAETLDVSGSILAAMVIGDGDGGTVTLDVKEDLSLSNGTHVKSQATYGNGDAGDLLIESGSLTLDNAFIRSISYLSDAGKAGSVIIAVDGTLEMMNGSDIYNCTLWGADTGDVKINTGSLVMDHSKIKTATLTLFTDTIGDAGDITITAENSLQVLNGAHISISTSSQGNGGDTHITADNLIIDGQGTETGIFQDVSSTGSVGTLTVAVTEQLDILNGGMISNSTNGAGDSGDLKITAGNLTIDGQGYIAGIYNDARSTGNAGSLTVDVTDQLEILEWGQISNAAVDQGSTGDLYVTATSLSIDGKGSLSAVETGIFGDTFIEGQAGSIKLEISDQIAIIKGCIIASTYGDGNGGTIEINTNKLIIDGKGEDGGISSDSHGEGNGGDIILNVTGYLEIIDSGNISSEIHGNGDAGTISITAGNLTIQDGETDGTGRATGIVTGSHEESTGNAGDIYIQVSDLIQVIDRGYIWASTTGEGNAGTITLSVSGLVELINGGLIVSNTFSKGDAGTISIKAANMTIDGQGNFTGITSNADIGSEGNAGSIEITLGELLQILNGGEISSSTRAEGDAGAITISADHIQIDGKGNDIGVFSNALDGSEGNAGTITLSASGIVELINGGQISNNTSSEGNAGNIYFESDRLLIDGKENSNVQTGIFCKADSVFGGNAGEIVLHIDGKAEISGGGWVSSRTYSDKVGGNIEIEAKSLLFEGSGIDSATLGGAKGGDISINIDEDVVLRNGRGIASTSMGEGDAGDITLNTKYLLLDGNGFDTVIDSSTHKSGNAGNIQINVAETINILNKGQIRSVTIGTGDAGIIYIESGSLLIDAEGLNYGIACGTGIDSDGDAGQVTLNVDGKVELTHGGTISCSTQGAGDAGDIFVSAEHLLIHDGYDSAIVCEARENSSGDAGDITLNIAGNIELLDGGTISCSTASHGDAGNIFLTADRLLIQGNVIGAGIISITNENSIGEGGNIEITTLEDIELKKLAVISTSTLGEGNAGDINLKTSGLLVDGEGMVSLLASSAEIGSSGKAGSISINAANKVKILHGGQININNRGIIDAEKMTSELAGLLKINAPYVCINSSQVTAQGTGNVQASAIELNVIDLVVEDESRITTDAQVAHGGPITIQGDIFLLKDSLVTTSVTGASGDGGNILLKGRDNSSMDALVLKGGFIQANTTANAAHGGDIFVNARAVIADGDQLLVGGEEPRSFEPGSRLSIIQAAAPGGEQGNIEVTAPELDIAGSLVRAEADFSRPSDLATDPCSASSGQGVNALVLDGRGGMPLLAEDLLDVPWNGQRLDRLVKTAVEEEAK